MSNENKKFKIYPPTVIVEENGNLINEIGIITLEILRMSFIASQKIYEIKEP